MKNSPAVNVLACKASPHQVGLSPLLSNHLHQGAAIKTKTVLLEAESVSEKIRKKIKTNNYAIISRLAYIKN